MLRRWIRSWSPMAVGYVAGAAGTGMLSAYDWCMDRQLDALPTLGGCHCWVAGAGGFVLGLLCAALMLLLRRLVEPLIARLYETFARLNPERAQGSAYFAFEEVYARRLDPLARSRASRAPPLVL